MLEVISSDPMPSTTPGEDFCLTPAQLRTLRGQYLRCLATGFGPDDFLNVVANAVKDSDGANDSPVKIRIVSAARKIAGWRPPLRLVNG